MTDNKKLVDRLDEEIKNHQSWVDNILELDYPTNEDQEHLDDLAMFTEIKGIVEQHDIVVKELLALREIVCTPEVAKALEKEHQPQPDELVEKLLKIGMRAEVDGLNYADTLENKPAKMLKIFDEARAEIRKLLKDYLPPRPSVTRDEIEELAIKIRDEVFDQHGGIMVDEEDIVDDIEYFLKSKGIEVKGE